MYAPGAAVSAAFVAPYTGAWIEISSGQKSSVLSGSLPTRERGLKSTYTYTAPAAASSLPTRERGLKYVVCKQAVSFAQRRSLHGSVD